jgi:hypothetical protein
MRRILTIGYDHDTESPCDYDGWKLYSFHPRHKREKDQEEFKTIGMRRKFSVGLAFVLDLYEHSGSAWSLSGSGMQCQWDTSRGAGVLIWEGKPGDIGAKTYDDRAADATRFLETYNEWANGQCYWFSIDDGDGNPIDSCGGFIGLDSLREAINESLGENDEIIVRGECKDIAEYMRLKGDVVDEWTEADETAGVHVI